MNKYDNNPIIAPTAITMINIFGSVKNFV